MSIDERISEALRRLVAGMGAMRIPADPCDADLVLSDVQTELATLRAQLATVTRERDSWRAQRDEVHAEMERQTQLKREERQAKLDAMRERDEALESGARMRAVLERVRDAMRATGQEPDGDDDPRRPLATAVWAALSAPAPGPTEREMRVAEALRVAMEALEELLPSPTSVKANVVERHLCMGRMWLRVAGVYVAIEGSQCFDPQFGEEVQEVRRWTGEDFKRIEERFAAPIRAALELLRAIAAKVTP